MTCCVSQKDDDDDEDWGEDTSAAAIEARMKDLTDAAKSLALNDDLEKTQQERLDIFYNYVKVSGRLERLNIFYNYVKAMNNNGLYHTQLRDDCFAWC